MKIICKICNAPKPFERSQGFSHIKEDEMCHNCRQITTHLKADWQCVIIGGVIFDMRTNEEYIRKCGICPTHIMLDDEIRVHHLEEYGRLPKALCLIYPNSAHLLCCMYNRDTEIDNVQTGAHMRLMRLMHGVTCDEQAHAMGTAPVRVIESERGNLSWSEPKADKYIDAMQRALTKLNKEKTDEKVD